MSTGGNSSSPSCTPLFEHTLMHATIRCANTNTLTRLRCSSHETTTTPTWICVTHTLHHQTGKRSPSSNGSHGQGHGQAPQNYRQLMNSLKYKKTWSLSAAIEFRQLANGIGGRIKNPTNTIEFISQHKVLADCRKDVTYRQFVCLVRPEKQNPTECNSR